jgi:hypothetical protein
VTIEDRPRLDTEHQAVLGPLVRVIEEAADDQPWALVGAAATQLHGVPCTAANLEFVTTDAAVHALAEMLDIATTWERGAHVAAARLQFMRGRVPVFVHANPTFHGAYDSLTPLEIPSLWDARTRVEIEGATVLATPLEWELLLSVILGNRERTEAIQAFVKEHDCCDGRLLTRLMREGHVESETEEAVWAVIGR